MGYYTNFDLRVKKPDDELDDAQLAADLGNLFDDVYDDGELVRANAHTKWYDFEADMRELSKNYPALLFITDGQGEESTDLWRCYIQNGKSQHVDAEIVYAEYDPAKMVGD